MKTYFLDLFSGIGGFALGAYWAGLRFDGHYYSEIDDYAIRVYQQRFPDAVGLGDITKISGRDLPAGDWIIAGGFPCQDISVAGKGAGLEGSRSGLWYEYARIIGELRPRIALMENVGALTFRGLDAVLGSLAEIGYDAEWQDVRASDVGAPHRRERIWIVAYPDTMHDPRSAKPREQLARPTQSPRSGSDRMESGHDVADAECSGLEGFRPVTREAPHPKPRDSGTSVRYATSARFPDWTKKQMGQPAKIKKPERPNRWATEPDVGRVAHGIPARMDRLKCLGNSIVPQISELIFNQEAFDEWRKANG